MYDFTNPLNLNYLEGCRNAWVTAYNQVFIIYELSILVPEALNSYRDLVMLNFLRDLSFAYITPLEYLYPMIAYCDTSYYQFIDVHVNIFNLIAYNPIEIPYNILRKLGTILRNGMTFWDCFN